LFKKAQEKLQGPNLVELEGKVSSLTDQLSAVKENLNLLQGDQSALERISLVECIETIDTLTNSLGKLNKK